MSDKVGRFIQRITDEMDKLFEDPFVGIKPTCTECKTKITVQEYTDLPEWSPYTSVSFEKCTECDALYATYTHRAAVERIFITVNLKEDE